MDANQYIKHLTECIALATSFKPMTEKERLAHAQRCAAEMVCAERRRQSENKQQAVNEVAS